MQWVHAIIDQPGISSRTVEHGPNGLRVQIKGTVAPPGWEEHRDHMVDWLLEDHSAYGFSALGIGAAPEKGPLIPSFVLTFYVTPQASAKTPTPEGGAMQCVHDAVEELLAAQKQLKLLSEACRTAMLGRSLAYADALQAKIDAVEDHITDALAKLGG